MINEQTISAEKQQQFTAWLNQQIKLTQADSIYTIPQNEWESYESAANSDQFKQFVKSFTIISEACLKVLLQFFTKLMTKDSSYSQRCRCWRGLYLVIEKMILEREAGGAHNYQSLVAQVINQLNIYSNTHCLDSTPQKQQQKNILAVYQSLLCLKDVSSSSILQLTDIMMKAESLAEELSSQLFKLDQWLQHKTLTFENSLTLCNIISKGTLGSHLEKGAGQFVNARFHYRNLLPALLRSLFSQTGQQRDSFLIGITQALQEEEALLEFYLEHLNSEQSQPVINSILKYTSWQMSQFISVKKVKLLLKNLKMSQPPENQILIQLHKLRSYVDMLKQLARRYPQPRMIIEFNTYNSTLTMQNFIREKQVTLCFIIEIKTLAGAVSVCSVNHKKGAIDFILKPIKEGEVNKLSLVIKLGEKVLLSETVYNNWKPMGELLFSLSNEGEGLSIYVNAIALTIRESSDFSRIQIGAVAPNQGFIGKLKLFTVFSPDVKPEQIYKGWIDCQGRMQAFFRCRTNDSVLCKMSRGDSLFKFISRQKGFFQRMFVKESKHTLHNCRSMLMPSMLQIIEQLGQLDCLLYFIQYINSLVPEHPQTCEILCGLFSVLKILCANDQFCEALDWLESSLSNLAHLMWLLFTRNILAAQSVRLILKVFDFLLYFQRRLKHQCNDEALNMCYRNLQCQVIKVVFLKLDVWVLCGFTQQMFVLKVIEKRLEDTNILNNFVESNSLRHILLCMLVNYNPAFHTDNKILPKKAILELQKALANICSLLIFEDNPCIERDFKSILMHIYAAHQSTLGYYCPSILKLFLQLLLNQILPLKSIVRFISQSNNNNLNQRIIYFFCKLLKKTTEAEILELLIDIIVRLIQMMPQLIQQTMMQAALTSLLSKSRDSGFIVAPYIHLLRKLSASSLSNIRLLLSRVISSIRQCYKLVGSLQCVERLQDSIMSLPQSILLPLINSDEGFDFLLTISVQQPQHQQIIMRMLENLFVFCWSSSEPHTGIPFIKNYLKVFDKVKLPVNSPLSTIHMLCECIDSKYLLKVLDANKLITNEPTLKFITAKQQLSNYPGGILAHILSRNSFSEDDISIIKSILTDRPRKIEKYCMEQNLIEYLLPDIIFLEILWTLLKNHMSGFKKKLSGLNASRKMSISSDIQSSKQSPVKSFKSSPIKQLRSQIQLEPQVERLLKIMAQMLQFPSINTNIAVFGQCENILTAFFEILNKEQDKQILLSSYVEMNSKLELNLPTSPVELQLQNSLISQIKNRLKSGDLSETFSYIDQNRKAFEQLVKVMNRYCKKDVILIRKVCYSSLKLDQQKLHPLPEVTVLAEYREERTNELVLELQDMFRNELSTLDKSSENSEELWRNLNNRNRFWLWDKKSQNDIYKVDLHQSPNFYHLNIKSAQSEYSAQYPRRVQQNLLLPIWDKKIERSGIMTSSTMTGIMSSSTVTEIRERKTTDSALKLESVEAPPKNSKNRYFAEYVTQRGVYFGVVWVKDGCLRFKSLKDSDRPTPKQYQLSTSEFHRITQPRQKIIPLQQSRLFTRRYILRHTAIEIFTTSKGYFLNLFTQDKRRSLINEVKDLLMECIVNRKQQFIKQDYTRKWLNGQYNNFEYLMLINRYSGRTYNDLSQFPVFPWVIANYDKACKSIGKEFYKNQSNLRNLELPIGCLNPSRLEGYKIRMGESQMNNLDQHFLYGSFYSNPTFIYNFFIRLEPFTTLHWDHQGKKIDHADRLFSGIQEQYRSATTNTSDVREIIPEFYYWPEFLKNRNQIELGKKQNKEEVGDAKLPGWAKTPQQFIFKMREALQSQQITEQLSSWIDLVFGYKSVYEEAEKHDNLFHYYTYEQDIFKFEDIDTIKMAQLNISEFGQVPEALFTKEHPRKKARHGIMVDHYRQIHVQPNATQFRLYPQGVMLMSDKQVTFLSTNFSIVSKADPKTFDTVSSACTLVVDREFSWVSVHDNHLYIYLNKKCKTKPYKLHSNVYLLTSKHLLVRAQDSRLLVQPLRITAEEQENKPQKLFGHQQNIYLIVANENADVLLSVDRDNLVLVHYISSLKYLRMFKLNLNLGETVIQLRIHDMGYFVFLTSESRLLVYTFIGQLFVQSDLSTESDGQRVTNLQIMSEWQSQILLSTTYGSIYQMDFFELWRFKADFAHFPFKLKTKRNILSRCRQDSNKDIQYRDITRQEILHFQLIKSSNEYKVLFKVLVLYRDGQLLCFYEKQMMKENIQNSPLLKQMGIV